MTKGAPHYLIKYNANLQRKRHYLTRRERERERERDWKDELWKINLKNNKINYIIRQDQSKTELVQHLHACAFSPVSSTLQKCINKGNFLSWSGIEDLDFNKLLKTTEATIKGHLDQERKNLQSTKLNKQHKIDLKITFQTK